jgi:hypothetical protein
MARLTALLCCLLTATVFAAEPDPRSAPAPKATVPEPKVEQIVLEDDGARIDETRVRGETKKVSVQPKGPGGIKAPAYEIVVEDAGRQSAAGSDRSTAGRRVWRILNF